MSYIYFYHYTSTYGKDSIISDGQINRTSHPSHKWFGEGTYGTTMAPHEGKENIADNNWPGYGARKIQSGLVDWAIEVRIPESEVERPTAFRNILKHKGPIILKSYIWKSIEVTTP